MTFSSSIGSGGRAANPSWLNALLGAALLLVAGLDLMLIVGIGWSAWQRATLSERWQHMRQEDSSQGLGPQAEAQELRNAIALTQQNISDTVNGLPTDADAAHQAADLRLQASALGVAISELSPQPLEGAATTVPIRQFVLRAHGTWPQLLAFFTQIAQTCSSTTRIENVSLLQQGEQAELDLTLVIAVRPFAADGSGGYPGDSRPEALQEGSRR